MVVSLSNLSPRFTNKKGSSEFHSFQVLQLQSSVMINSASGGSKVRSLSLDRRFRLSEWINVVAKKVMCLGSGGWLVLVGGVETFHSLRLKVLEGDF